MFQKVDHGVNKGLDLKILSFFGDKVKVNQERIIRWCNFDSVDDFVIVGTSWFFAHVADLSALQNQQIELVFEWLYDLLRMADHHLYLFRQREECLLDEIMEESQILKYIFIRFPKYLSLETVR